MSEFGTLDLEEMAGEGQRLTADREDFLQQFVPMPQAKVGETKVVEVRILPPVRGGKLFQFTRLHTINGRRYHCPKPLVNGKWDKNVPCPICDYYNALWRAADQAEEKGNKDLSERLKNEARSIKPVERYYYNAIVRKLTDEKGVHLNVGPRILSVGKSLHKTIVRGIVGDETQKPLGNVTDPKTGIDFVIKVEAKGTGKELYPNYDRSDFAREASILGTPEEIAVWIENLHDLSKLRNVKAYDMLEHELAIHRGLIPDDMSNDGFDIDKFDAKFKNTTSVSVPDMSSVDNLVDAVTAQPTQSEVEAPQASVTIDDAEFLQTLEDMKEA